MIINMKENLKKVIVPKEITDMYSMNYDYKANEIGTEIKQQQKRDCNCNWTCDSYVGGSTSNCLPSKSDAVFMGISCERRVGPVL
jgi:hypothetical protein